MLRSMQDLENYAIPATDGSRGVLTAGTSRSFPSRRRSWDAYPASGLREQEGS